MECRTIKFRTLMGIILILVAAPCASAQSLTENLRAEPVSALAADARRNGDAIRGALLFPQQKSGCANCHVPGNDQLMGPDLTRPERALTDVELVESLLEPSKRIRQGFETVTAVTTNGKSIVGRIIGKSDDSLVLRTAEQKPVTLPISAIEEVIAMKASGMPEKLADQLTDRQQFLDLVRYLMEITTAGASVSIPHQGGERISERMHGRVLLQEFNCGACHRNTMHTRLTDNVAPNLAWSAEQLNPDYIADFIADPRRTKPGTRMPDLMASVSEKERRLTAEQITHYLTANRSNTYQSQPAIEEHWERGYELFHSVGCLACHADPEGNDKEQPDEFAVPLGKLNKKYSIDALVSFLKDPHIVRPSGRMPNMQLDHWEATDIAHYLAGTSVDSPRDVFRADPQLVGAGRLQFRQLGCVACHAMEDTAGRRSQLVSLAEVRPDRGCLSSESGGWPQFDLTEFQRRAMQLALQDLATMPDDAQQIALSLTALRCLNCHQRDRLGGIAPQHDRHFQTTNPNLGPQGRIPPTLTGVGAKLQPKWMRQVLVSGRSIRPYMKTRMPRFGANNVVHLIDLFQKTDRLPEVRFPEFSDQKKMREAGFELTGSGGLNCIACHTFQLKPAATMSAVDLTEMSERLKKGWFFHYMKSPQQLSLNTVMPSFWPGGRAIRKEVLNADTDLQIEALWQYLLDGRQARVPKGLVRERMELLATDEAVMLRRSYQSVGKRGIGVGYPRQVNLVYDAEQMRLAMLWKGKFADPGGVWRSQGHGVVNPLSRPLRFVAGPDVDDVTSPWIVDEGRPPRHQFRGYSLDEKQRPVFSYQFDDAAVSDYFVDAQSAGDPSPVLRRTLTVDSSGPHNLSFRLISGKTILPQPDGSFVVDNLLNVRVVSPQQAEVVDTNEVKLLRIPLPVSNGVTKAIVDYSWKNGL